MFYHDDIILPCEIIEGIRLVAVDDVAVMKIDVVSRKGRKKDFWDIHEMLTHYNIGKMIELCRERHPWDHNPEEIIANLADFSLADQFPDPVCLRGKYWGLIKEDFTELR